MSAGSGRLDNRRWRLEAASVLLLLAVGLALRLYICRAWVFAGTDSYGYLKLADELRLHGRYALAPEPAPLHWGRPPLYPIFLAFAKGAAVAGMQGGEGWSRITHAQLWLDLLGTGVLVYWLARRLANSHLAGLLALALAMVMPFSATYVGAVLTETQAMALATAVVAALVLGRGRPRRWFPVAGALIGLSALTRPDGLLLAAGLVPALLYVGAGPGRWRERALVGALSLAGFTLSFAPWMARNWWHFGRAYPLGSRVDHTTAPIPYWQGPHHWMRSYATDWRPLTRTNTCMWKPSCVLSPVLLEREHAFDSTEDRTATLEVLAERDRDGVTEEVAQKFAALALAHRRAHPWRVLVWLPLSRAWHMWADPYDEIVQRPPPLFGKKWLRRGWLLTWLMALICVSGAWLLRHGPLPAGAAIILTVIAFRTVVLAWECYTMPRYIREVFPMAYALVAAGMVVLLGTALVRRPTLDNLSPGR